MLMSNNNKKGKKNREIAVAGYFGGEDRIENEESKVIIRVDSNNIMCTV